MLLTLTVLLLVQPSALLARAQEAGTLPRQVIVAGVVGATLRSGPDGASAALAIVPEGGVLTVMGPAQVTNGVVWLPVRTAEGVAGYLPAGLLAPADGGSLPALPLLSAETAQQQPAASGTRDPSSVARAGNTAAGLPGAPTTPGDPSQRQMPTPTLATTVPAATPTSTSGVPAPTQRTPRTTVERLRGRDVTVTILDEEPAPNGHPMGAGRIVVGFKPGATQTARMQAHQAAGATAAARAGIPEVAAVEVQPGTVQQALTAYRARADVAWAEPDYVRRATLEPNDPLLPSQHGVNKIGSQIAWDVTNGSPALKIAILDCGIFSESSTYEPPDGGAGHEDLRGKVVLERNFSNTETGVDDWCNHGTRMAGIAAARTNVEPAVGIAGVSFQSQILNGKVLNDRGSGLDSWVADGIVWATDNGADIINLSLGGATPCSQTLQTAVNYAWQRGAVLAAAAGNGGDDQLGDPLSDAPANCSHVISVGAIGQDDSRASFSNYGPPDAPRVQIAAPGVEVVTTNYLGTYSNVSGTSPATPHVAGVAALIKAHAGGTNQSIVDRLLSTADPIAGTGTLWAHGRLNAAAAVGPVACSPRPKVTVSPRVNGSGLDVHVSVEGRGNALRYVRVGGNSGASTNATLAFPGTMSQSQGAQLHVPPTVRSSLMFRLTRKVAGEPTTVPFTVYDGCGAWNTFVGGGTNAGF